MELGSGIIKYRPRNSSNVLRRESFEKSAHNSLNNQQSLAKSSDVEKVSSGAKDKVSISDTAKKMAQNDIAKKVQSAGEQAVQKMVSDTLTSPPPLGTTEEIAEDGVKKLSPARSKEAGLVRKPAIIFIGGFNFLGLSKANTELKKMSEYVEGAKYFDHGDKKEIVAEIKKRPIGEKIILVGQGLGADTAMDVANEMNAIQNGFRKIDLLVTLDSVGLNNDIVPQTVKKNLNFISDSSSPFSDGPNIARNTDETEVINFLRQGNIIESQDVQYRIMDSLNSLLGD